MATEFDPIWAEGCEVARGRDELRPWPPLASIGLAATVSAILWVLIIRGALALL